MTSAERMEGVYLKQPIDRVPVVFSGSSYAAFITGYTSKEFYTDINVAFNTLEWMNKLHKHDGIGNINYNVPELGCWDFGGEVEFREYPRITLPMAIRRPVINEDDIEKLEIPTVKTGEYSKRNFEFNKMAFKKGYGIDLTIGSSMDIAHSILGLDLLMKWVIKKPELIHIIMEKVGIYYEQLLDEYINEFGVENFSVSANFPIESNLIMSPKMFEKFSLPYIVKLHKKAIEKGVKKWTIHLCGDHSKNVTFWKNEIPLAPRTNFLLSHEFDPLEFANYIGDEHIVSGNLWTRTLFSGTPDEVYKEGERIVKLMKHIPGGFILAPDCATPATTPPGNIQAMIQAAIDFGRY